MEWDEAQGRVGHKREFKFNLKSSEKVLKSYNTYSRLYFKEIVLAILQRLACRMR